jgi:TolA-binding protein
MKSFSKESKDKIVLDLKQVSNNWGSLLSKYDEEISKNHQEIEKLSQTLDSLKDNKSISGSISKEIEDRESNIKKIRSSKKDLIDYLDIKKSQIGKLVSRSKIQEDNKKEIMETLK